MKTRIELTDDLLREALRVDRVSAPARLRAEVRAAVEADARGRSRVPRGLSFVMQPVWILLLLLVVLVMAMSAIAIGTGLLERRDIHTSVGPPFSPSPFTSTQAPSVVAPQPTSAAAESPPTLPRRDGALTLMPYDPTIYRWTTTDESPLVFQYREPNGVDFSVESIPGMAGLTSGGGSGLSYGHVSDGETSSFAVGARGVVIADVTDAFTRAVIDDPSAEPARDASELLADLEAAGHTLGEISTTQLAGHAALAVDVTSDLPFPFIEWRIRDGIPHGLIDLYGRTRLVVADFPNGRIILAQSWAGERGAFFSGGAELDAWLPRATELLESLTLASDAADGSFALASWLDPGLDSLLFEYDLPPDVELSIESVPGVVGMSAGAAKGLAYGWVGTGEDRSFADGARGVVIADVTGATLHSNESPPPATSAAEFLANLDALAVGDQGYTFGQAVEADVAGYPAVAVDVTSDLSYPVLEMGDASHIVDLGGRSRLIVVDLPEDRIMLVQIWAGSRAESSETDQAEWVPVANEFLDSLRLARSGTER